MPNFTKSSDAVSGAVFVSTPDGDFVIPADGHLEVEEALAAELRLIPSLVEVEPVEDTPAPKADAAPAEAPTKEKK